MQFRAREYVIPPQSNWRRSCWLYPDTVWSRVGCWC